MAIAMMRGGIPSAQTKKNFLKNLLTNYQKYGIIKYNLKKEVMNMITAKNARERVNQIIQKEIANERKLAAEKRYEEAKK